jgi:processive 1,2-diacylglycerol beta-glucosyltransferase
MARKRVLIMSTSAGTGHVRAAAALEQAFAEDPRVERVVNKDALRYTNKLFRDFYSKLYTTLVRSAPEFLGWWYDASDEPWRTDAARHMIDRLNTGPLVRFIRDFRPDITVCTHFMPAGIISHLIATGKLDAHLSIVVTDLDFHAMWLSRAFHRYFVAIEETKAHLEMLGLPSERITVSGIPIGPEFGGKADRREIRTRHGLDPDKTTLLISGGALGVGPAEFMVERLLHLKHDVQALVLCGENRRLRKRVEAVVDGNRPGFIVLGYVDGIHELMTASDLFVGKPGGLTTAEVLASGLPMAVVSPIPGQEVRNADHLLEDGVAVKCNELTTIAYKIDRLLDDPARLALMRENALKLAKPDAADTIVETLIEDRLPPLAIDAAKKKAIADAAAADETRRRPRNAGPLSW